MPASRRHRRWPALALVLATGLAVASFLWPGWRGDHRLRGAEAEADRLDPGWRFEELLAVCEEPPTGLNSAAVVQAAKRHIPAGWPNTPHYDGPNPDGPSLDERLDTDSPEVAPAPATLALLRARLAKVGPSLSVSLKLADLPAGRYEVRGVPDPVTVVHPAQDARPVGNLLRLEALRRAFEGEADAALVALRASLNAGRSVGDEPSLTALTIRASVVTAAANATERVLAQCRPGDDEMAVLQSAFLSEADEPLLLTGLRGERAVWYHYLTTPHDTRTTIKGSAGTGGAVAADMLSLGTFAVELAKQPSERWSRGFAEYNRRAITAPQMVASVAPAVVKFAEAQRRRMAALRCAGVGLAAERYRQATGGWPAGLDDMVEAGFLASVPADPYDGAPLRYAPRPDGMMTYSVGPDLHDDGGNRSDHNSGLPGTDVCFRLWDSGQRGKSPFPRDLDATRLFMPPGNPVTP
jgi:hypothetical protein